jgi:hypothetical protein
MEKDEIVYMLCGGCLNSIPKGHMQHEMCKKSL